MPLSNAATNSINRKDLLYRDEIIDILVLAGDTSYVSHFSGQMYRWYPSEVFEFIALIDEANSSKYLVADASEKHIPDFLLKETDVSQ